MAATYKFADGDQVTLALEYFDECKTHEVYTVMRRPDRNASNTFPYIIAGPGIMKECYLVAYREPRPLTLREVWPG